VALGRAEVERDNMRLLAVHAAWVINVWLERGHRVSAAELLGERKTIDASTCANPSDLSARVAAMARARSEQ